MTADNYDLQDKTPGNKEGKLDKDKRGKSENIKENKIDYSDVDQGLTVAPNPQEGQTVPVTEQALESKGKGSTKGAADFAKHKDEFKCSYCSVNLRAGGIGKVVPVPGKKVRKNKENKYAFRTPGADDGKLAGVLCEACTRNAENLPEGAIDIKNVPAIMADGTVQNIPVNSL